MDDPLCNGICRSYLGVLLSEVRHSTYDLIIIHPFLFFLILTRPFTLVSYVTSHLDRDYTRETVKPENGYVAIDIHDKNYPAHIWFYIFCGLLDAMWQTTAYWMMGAMSNDPSKLAYMAGFCTCISFVVFWGFFLSFREVGIWMID